MQLNSPCQVKLTPLLRSAEVFLNITDMGLFNFYVYADTIECIIAMMASRVSDIRGYVKKINVDICRELKTMQYYTSQRRVIVTFHCP